MDSDSLPKHFNVPATPHGKVVILPSNEVKDIVDLPAKYDVFVDRGSGRCDELSTVEYSVYAGANFIMVVLIGVAFTYAYTRLRKSSAAAEATYIRASVLIAAVFFIVATISLFLGISGAVELKLGGVEVNTALPSILLFVISFLAWRETKPAKFNGTAIQQAGEPDR